MLHSLPREVLTCGEVALVDAENPCGGRCAERRTSEGPGTGALVLPPSSRGLAIPCRKCVKPRKSRGLGLPLSQFLTCIGRVATKAVQPGFRRVLCRFERLHFFLP